MIQLMNTNLKLKEINGYLVPTEASVPTGISLDGLCRSPLIFIPARIPVIAGKNTPKTVNQFS